MATSTLDSPGPSTKSSPDQTIDDRKYPILASRDPIKGHQNRKTYASFGDNGTTASANAFGRIMQISSFFGVGNSGFFCVDQPRVSEPCFVKYRMQELTELIDDPRAGLGISPGRGSQALWQGNNAQPDLDFVHDRWPRFTFPPSELSQPLESFSPNATEERSVQKGPDRSQSLKLSVQYYCSGGTVFQRYIWESTDTSDRLPETPKFTFNLDLLIRDLDFADWSNPFNEDNGRGLSGYSIVNIPDQKGIILAHRLSPGRGSRDKSLREIQTESSSTTDSTTPIAVGLVVMAFSDGTSQKIKAAEGERTFEIILSPETKKKSILEMTMAYRLQTISANNWDSSVIPMTDLKQMKSVFSSETDFRFRQLRFSSNQHFDFIVRRNLEHILSVCSVPLRKQTSDGFETPIALTCGDLSGHRVVTAASFFTFQFLLAILKYISDEKDTLKQYLMDPSQCSCTGTDLCGACQSMAEYKEELQERISTTCRGHIYWICEETKPAEDGGFAPHYWPTGEPISGLSHSHPSMRIESPMQVLKVSDFISDVSFSRWLPRNDSLIENGLKPKVRPWMMALDRENIRGTFVFPKQRDMGEKKFRLSDHVWICRGIQGIEVMDLNYEPQSQHETQDEIFDQYSFSGLRKTIVKRFTTENPFSNQRMLATCRSPSETRFLLHSKDTVLFHAMESGFFADENGRKDNKSEERAKQTQDSDKSWKYALDLWKNTVQAQSFHDDYQELDWEKPLRHGLVLILSSQGRRINKSSPDVVLDKTLDFLLDISSPNGLIPGLVEKRNPVAFQSSLGVDSYWHTAFEVPFILWSYGKQHLEADPQKSPKGNASDGSPEMTLSKENGAKIGQIVRKNVPFAMFNNLIDQKLLIEITDDWLHDGPTAVDFDVRPDFGVLKENGKVSPDMIVGEPGTIIQAALNVPYLVKSSLSAGTARGLIINIKRHSEGTELVGSPVNNGEILSALEKRRTVWGAKKRLIWCPKGDKATALLCYLASPTSERENMSAFFDRHARYEKYFFDSTSATLNEWETELHLSFFRMTDGAQNSILTYPSDPFNEIPEPSFVTLSSPGNDSERVKNIARASRSFRFVGDFFDRYWTCHLLEYGSSQQPADNLESRLTKLGHIRRNLPHHSKAYMRPWQQRKVLELLLFNEMLEDIFCCTDQIWKWVRDNVLSGPSKKHDSRSFMIPGLINVLRSDTQNPLAETLFDAVEFVNLSSGDTYISITERWRFFEQLLQALEEDLTGNLEKINEWSSREKDREQARPRWTKNDEKTYRSAITKLSILNERKTRDLDRLRASIQVFRESLNNRLASIRDDMSFRGSQNMNIFTYVTVVFLPLGFATGIFSMSGPPEQLTLGAMVATAFIALSVTVFALVNAKVLEKNMVKPAINISGRCGTSIFHFLVLVAYRPVQEVQKIYDKCKKCSERSRQEKEDARKSGDPEANGSLGTGSKRVAQAATEPNLN